jgi:hypothetical protein
MEHSHVTCTPMTVVGKSIAVYVWPFPVTSQPRAVIFCVGSHRILTERTPFFTPISTLHCPNYSPLLFHLSFSLDEVPPNFNFFYFLQQTHLTAPSLKNNETMEASQNRTFYFEVWSSFPFAHLYRWKEDNICQSIGGKSEVLWRTCWGIHWEFGEHIENLTRTHWELEGNIVGTHWEPGKKGKHLECMLGPSHCLHEISLPKRVGSPFLARANTLPIHTIVAPTIQCILCKF